MAKSKNIIEKIEQNKQETANIIQSIENEYHQEEIQQNKNKELEAYLYKKFVDDNQGKDFVDIDHINALGVDYDVLLFTSVKNTGKNVGIIYKLFKKYYAMGKKIIFLRTSQTEIIESKHEYNLSPDNPFKFETSKGVLTAIHKVTGEEVGIVRDMKFCNKGSGGEYANYAAIFFDEFLSWSNRQEITRGNLSNWAAFISSVTRSKKDGIKVYCVGNITTKNTALLNYYGISTEDKLRYIERYDINNPENVCKILYINANNIYKGITVQKGAVQGMAAEFRDELFNNRQALNNMAIIPDSIWNQLVPDLSFMYVITSATLVQVILFEVRKTEENRYKKTNKLYAIKGRLWEPHYTTKTDIYTDNPLIHHTTNKTTLIHSINDYLDMLNDLISAGLLYYTNKLTQDWVLKINAVIEKEKNKLFF